MKVFVSTPIAGFNDDQKYKKFREELIKFVNELDSMFGASNIFTALREVKNYDSYDSPEQSVVKDLEGIEQSDIFILIYPQKVASSALVELGYALALNKLIYIYANQERDLPYMVNGFEKCFPARVQKYIGKWETCYDVILSKLKRDFII